MATNDNSGLFVAEDDFDDVYDNGTEPQPPQPAQADQPDNGAIAELPDENSRENGQPQGGQQEDNQQNRQPPQETIDLTNEPDDGPGELLQSEGLKKGPANRVSEMYYLRRFRKDIPKSEVYTRLRKRYSEIFKRQASNAMPERDLKQRMEEIAQKVLAVEIGYLIDRDQKTWFTVLRRARKALQLELQQLEGMLEKLERPERQNAFREGLLSDAQAKVDQIEKDLKTREKLIEELKIFAKLD